MVTVLSYGAFAQAQTAEPKKMEKGMNHQRRHADGVMMQNGKMMMVKAQKMTAMESELTLSNGTKIMTDGSYTTANGTNMMLKEGQHMDMMGKVTTMKMKRLKK